MAAEGEFKDRVALVTGGGGGLGRATSIALARLGARVVVADVAVTAGEETARLIGSAGGEARFVECDVTDHAAVEQMIATVVGLFGQLDIAVNNAGIEGIRAKAAEYPIDQWRRVIDVNLTSVYLCMRAEIPQMLKQGAGIIVNVASVAGLIGFPGSSAYSASKHGVVGLTKSAALEYARKGLRINAICPGYTRTRMVEQMFEGRPNLEERLTEAVPLGRLGMPEEIAEGVVYLCSDRTAFMVGQALTLDGGLTAQ